MQRTTHLNADKGAILAQSSGETPAPRVHHSRLPWIAAGAALSLFGMVAAFGTVSPTPEPPVTQTLMVETLALAAPVAVNTEGDYFSEERFQRGDTIASLLERLGVDDSDIEVLRRSSASTLKGLRPGATVQARVGTEGELRSLSFLGSRDQLTTTTIERDGDAFKVTEAAAPLERRAVMKSAAIRTSLFAATDDADIPDSVASQLAEIFAGDIDFHRDLRQGDHLSVVYESLAFNGREVKSGRVLAAEFVNQGKSFRAVWYAEDEAGRTGAYYTPEGKSLRKAFLRSPLEFSRISSGFGLRMHPIQQRWRQHTGVDYAAPEGTRVKATADGIVDFVGQQGGYGNIVQIKHQSGYATWYAHLSAFAKGLHRGMRIAQGDLIGFVGHTGWATGPHLHYEFRVNNQFRNPLAMSFPAAIPIGPDRLPRFNERTQPLLAQLELLRHSNVAPLE